MEKKKNPKKAAETRSAKQDLSNLQPLSDARVDDLQIEVRELKKLTEKYHSEQKNIIVGTVIATGVAVLLIVVSVVVEVIIFNSSYKDSLDEVQKQHFDDYKALQDSVNDTRNDLNKQLIDRLPKP